MRRTRHKGRAHLNESLAVGSAIAVTDGQVHALLSIHDLAFLQKVHHVLGCAIPGQASQLHDVAIVHVVYAHVSEKNQTNCQFASKVNGKKPKRRDFVEMRCASTSTTSIVVKQCK